MDKKQFKMVAEPPEVTFNVTFMPEETDVYQGALSVVPTRETQELETAGFTFLKNLTVEGIPDNYVDVSADTVTAETLAEGATAHDASGNAVVGVAKIPDRDYKADLVNYIQEGKISVLPDGITKIRDSAFGGLTNVVITEVPEGVTRIGRYAFDGCANIAFTRLPDGITSIGECAFQRCSKLQIEELPSRLSRVEKSTFYYCTGLKKMTLPESVKYIDSYAFGSCSSLETLVIPAGVVSIDRYAFNSCAALTTVRIKATTPPKLYNGVFGTTVNANLKIYVPKGTADAYKAANYWKDYADKIVEESE